MANDLFHCKDQNKVGQGIYKKTKIRYDCGTIPLKNAKIKYNLGFIPLKRLE